MISFDDNHLLIFVSLSMQYYDPYAVRSLWIMKMYNKEQNWITKIFKRNIFYG